MNRKMLALIFGCLVAGLLPGQTPTFATVRPDRGFMAYGSYLLSETETINEGTGGLTLRFPLASLPSGRGGFRQGVELFYNSQLYKLETITTPPGYLLPLCSQSPLDCPADINALGYDSNLGGWRYGFQYRFDIETRPGILSCSPQPRNEEIHLYKYTITLPDGSTHLLRMTQSTDNFGDGYYRHWINGTSTVCVPTAAIATPVKFHTTDGSFLQAVVTPSTVGGVTTWTWTLTFPDGRRVSGSGRYANQICDRNNNCVSIQNSIDSTTNAPITELSDAFGRRIRLRYNIQGTCPNAPDDCSSSSDDIMQAGFGGNGATPNVAPNYQWTVSWTNTSLSNPAGGYTCYSPSGSLTTPYTCQYLAASHRVVSSITLPTSSNLKYSFVYADSAAPSGKKGWGELRTMLLPNAAGNASAPDTYRPRIEYGWKHTETSANRLVISSPVNPIVSKTVYRTESLNGTTTDLNETWSYTSPDADYGISTGSITAPDGGITTTTFFASTPANYFAGLKWKTVSPLGAVTESYWTRNEPWIGTTANTDKQNAFVKAEYRKPVGGTNYSAMVTTQEKNGSVLSITEYDFGIASIPRSQSTAPPNNVPTSGTILRKTDNSYHYESSSDAGAPTISLANAYWADHSIRYKGARSRTTHFGYGGSAKESVIDQKYDDPKTTANLLGEAIWDNPLTVPAVSSNSFPSRQADNSDITEYEWNSGNVTKITDPESDVTDFTNGSLPGCSFLYSNLHPTKVTAHSGQGTLAEETDFTYDCATGVLKTAKREPGQGAKAVTTTGGYDLFARLTSQEAATGSTGATKLHRSETQPDDAARVLRTASSLDGATDLKLAAVYSFDGLGQLEKERRNDDSSGAVTSASTNGIVVERAMRYESGVGRYQLESSAYKPTPDVAQPERAWNRKKFDQDGRLVAVHTFRGSTLPYPWAGESDDLTNVISSTTYSYSSGNMVTITDAAGKTRTETRDALGRLTSVSQSGVAATSYTYNSRDQLLTVTQTDSATYGTAKTQTRTFEYYPQGRLKSAENPESGTTSYTYYRNGNLKTRTDARGVTVTLAYDGAKRLQTKTYSDGTPTVRYCYDGQVYSGVSCGTLAGRDTDAADYPKGRLTGVGNPNSSTNYEQVDALGRTTRMKQTVAGMAPGGKTISYVWGSGGAMKRMDLPSGRQVTYTLTDAGRVSSVAGLLSTTTTYMSNAKFTAAGAPLEWNLSGTTMTEKREYNAIGQMTSMEAKHGTALRLRLTMDYPSAGNNGNLLGQKIETGAATLQQYFGYDSANRLRMALEKPSNTADLSASTCAAIGVSGSEWCQRFKFDGFGNAWSEENVSPSGAVAGLAANGSSWYLVGGTTVNNRLNSVSHDLAGNQTEVRIGNEQRVGTYDAEGRLTQVTEGGTVGQYFYDGEGRRVKRVAGGKTTYYVYGVDGALVAEYEDGTPTLVAATEYLLTDHLGSVRAKASGGGTVVARHDYEPFGAEVVRSGYGTDSLAQRFTGKERDVETGLDYFGARYLSATMGRFTSVDPYSPILVRQFALAGGVPAKVADDQFQAFISRPQKWNAFSYVQNQPLTMVDPFGAQDGHHGFTVREQYSGLAGHFTESIKTGPLTQAGKEFHKWDQNHVAYNKAVETYLRSKEVAMGLSRHTWTISQWRAVANDMFNNPAIADYLGKLDAKSPGAIAALRLAISNYHVPMKLLIQTAVADLLSFIRMFPVVIYIDEGRRPGNTTGELNVIKGQATCLLDCETGRCAI